MAYIFDPAELHRVARGALDVPTDALVDHLATELAKSYPGHITRPTEWVFNNAGGAMGMLTIFHASLSEYIILFGTPIGTEGHSGRYWAEEYFFILKGEHWTYDEGQMDRTVYRPGDMHILPRGTVRGYRIPDHCWAIEYVRGNVPSMLPFGLADSFMSTLDYPTVAKLFRLYGREVIKELLQGKI